MATASTTIDVSRIIKLSIAIILLGMFIVLCVVLGLAKNLPSIEQLENYDPDLVTRIYSADGKVLEELFVQKRVFIELDKIPTHMQNAVVASEDRRFYDHWGLSLRSVARAVMINTLSMSYRQGFSTLTQQLARNLYKSVGFEDSVVRKLKEVITAVQIERTYTKDEILEMYLNTVHFGHGTYGVEAATKRFFGKESKDLSIDESALLVGLLPAPASYSPIHHPERAACRRRTRSSIRGGHRIEMTSPRCSHSHRTRGPGSRSRPRPSTEVDQRCWMESDRACGRSRSGRPMS